MKIPSRILLLIGLLVLSSCTSTGGRLVSAGTTNKVFDMQIETSLDWSKQRFGRYEFWTIDGSNLNELSIFSKVKPRENVFLGQRESKRRPDGAWYKPGLRPDELQDLIIDGATRYGWVNAAASNLRPAKVSGANGIRFDLKMTHPTGLNYAGTVLALERDDRLTILVWTAPVEHYYDRDIAAVNKLMDSVRFIK